MTNTNTPEFTPMIVGYSTDESIKTFTMLYEIICDEATALKANLEMLFREDEELVTHDLLQELLNSEPETFIRTAWVKHKKINPPGINLERLIQSELLDIPKYDEIIASVSYLKNMLREASKSPFTFPLEKLINADAYYSLNDDFHQALQEYGVVYTKSEAENKVLEAVTKLKDAINSLCNMRLLPVNNLSNIGLRFDRHVLRRTGRDDCPFDLNPNMFKTVLRNLPGVK